MRRIPSASKPYFDRVASDWDRLRQSFFSGAVREKAYAAADVRPGQLAIDVGAGTGYMTEGLVERGVRVIAVEQSEAMIEQMRIKFGANAPVDYRRGDAAKIPLGGAAADHVFANMYLHHAESPPEAIREMARLLRPGGRLIVTDLDEHHFEFLRTEHHDRWMGFNRSDVARWFADAGLRDVRVESVGESCCADASDAAPAARVDVWIARGQR